MKKVVTLARTPAHSPGEGKVLRLRLEILAALTAFLPFAVFSTTAQELNARLNSPRPDKDSPAPGGEGPGENFPSRSSRLEHQNDGMPPLPACGHPLLHSEWRRGTGRGGVAVQGEGGRCSTNLHRNHWHVWFALVGVVSLISPAAIAAESSVPDWVRATEHAAFSPRDTAEGVVFGGKLWLSNGYVTGSTLARDLWSSTNGVSWSLVTTNTPYDGYAEMAVYAGKVWAVKQSVWNSADGVHWQQVAEKTPFGIRGYGELLVHDGRLWQLGSGEDVWNTTDGVTWKCVATNAPFGPRFASAAVAFKGKLWVLGGAVEKTNTPPETVYQQFTTFNDAWSSADGATWTRAVEPAPWGPRMWFVPIVHANRLWIIGGFDNRHRANFDDVWWTEDGMKWERLGTKTKFSPRHEVTAYIHDNRLWVVAGNSWPLMNDVWKLTPPLEFSGR